MTYAMDFYRNALLLRLVSLVLLVGIGGPVAWLLATLVQAGMHRFGRWAKAQPDHSAPAQ